jgi:transcriptional accessory protein Tex/SPT6
MAATVVAQLSEKDTSEAIASAVTALLTPEVMREMLTSTVASMLTEPERFSNDKRPKMKKLFEEAIVKRATLMVEEMISNDAVLNAQIQGMIKAALLEMFGNQEHRTKVVAHMAKYLAAAMTGSK